jgi:hypothetical protein
MASSIAVAADDAKAEKSRPENAPAKPVEEKAPEEKKPEVTPEVLLLTYLVRQYPNEHFDEAAISGIFRDIRGDLARSRELQEFPLLNSDEPAFVFRAVSPSVAAANL